MPIPLYDNARKNEAANFSVYKRLEQFNFDEVSFFVNTDILDKPFLSGIKDSKELMACSLALLRKD